MVRGFRCRGNARRHVVMVTRSLIAGVVMSLPFGDPPQIVKTLLGLPVWIAGGIAIFGKSSCSSCGHTWR